MEYLIYRLRCWIHGHKHTCCSNTKIRCSKCNLNWPPLEEVENLRWANNHTEYKSIAYGFCEAQDCCERCDSKMQILCKAKHWIDRIRLRIIKRHYGLKDKW